MVAREDAEAAGVDRHRVVNAELGAEVGDRTVAKLWISSREPCEIRRPLGLEPSHDRVVQREEARVGTALLQPLCPHFVEDAEGIVPVSLPELFIERAKEHARVAVPGPREIARDVGEAGESRRQERKAWWHDRWNRSCEAAVARL